MVKRSDFRPSNKSTGKISDKDRKIIQSKKSSQDSSAQELKREYEETQKKQKEEEVKKQAEIKRKNEDINSAYDGYGNKKPYYEKDIKSGKYIYFMTKEERDKFHSTFSLKHPLAVFDTGWKEANQ